jgi:hypothetical protein
MAARNWSEYQKQLLLGGDWLPVTSCIVFAKSSVEECARELALGVRGKKYGELSGGLSILNRVVKGATLDELLANLLPLHNVGGTKFLMLGTAKPGWTAVFDCDWRGFDPGGLTSWLAVGGIDTVTVWDSPHTVKSGSHQGFYGIRGVTVAAAIRGEAPIRSGIRVRAANMRTWELDGPFGIDTEFDWDPAAARVADHFTHDHLVSTTAKYGLRPYDEDFYAPDGTGIIVEEPVDPFGTIKQTTLAAARGEEPPAWRT